MMRQKSIIAIALVSATGLFSTNRAEAQLFGRSSYSSAGVGAGVYTGAPYAGPLGGFFSSSNYSGFYGNSPNMYAPATFGGSDHRSSQSSGLFGGSLLGNGSGIFGRRSSSSRNNQAPRGDGGRPDQNWTPGYDDGSQPLPLPSTGEPPLVDEPGSIETPRVAMPQPDVKPKSTNILTLEVRLPIENALVFVNDQLTRQTGTLRKFASPELFSDNNYQYDVRAEWIESGRKIIQSKTLNGKPGDRVVADFGR